MDREKVKQNIPFYKGMSDEQRDIFDSIWDAIETGTPVDPSKLQGMIDKAKMPPAVRKWFYDTAGPLLSGEGVPDYQDVYKQQKGALDVSLNEQVRGIQERFARQGIPRSSAMASGVGGAVGGYSQSLADMMTDIARMQETAKMNAFTRGMGLAEIGLNWQQQDISNESAMANFLNSLYLQDIGLQSDALDYLTQQQIMEQNVNVQAGQQWGWETTSALDYVGEAIELGLAAFGAPSFDFGGGGGDYNPATDWMTNRGGETGLI